MARQTRGARMVKQWTSLLSNSNAFTADATAVIRALAFTEASTILRMIGEYTISSTTVSVTFDAANIGIGIAVVSTDAAAVAAGGGVPEPITEPEYPWLYWAQHLMRFQSAELVQADGFSFVRKSIDIRSMRKVKPRESLVFVAEYIDGGGDPPVMVGLSGIRVLIATH